MWDVNSPYNQTGGLEANTAEYRSIIRAILASPHYYPYLLSEAVQATLRQLTHIGYGDGLVPFRENTNPYWKVQRFSGYELKKYMSSLQNRGQLSFTNLNERAYGTQLLALVILGLLATGGFTVVPPKTVAKSSQPLLSNDIRLLLVVIGLGLVTNALVTGALANVLDRLQGRVAWLLPFVAVLAIANEIPILIRWLHGYRRVAPPITSAEQ